MYDAAGRLGGEEILVITPVEAGEDWMSVFERLCARVAGSKMTTRSGELFVTVSIGVVCVAADSTVDEILETADKALYQAKNAGRNRVLAYGCKSKVFFMWIQTNNTHLTAIKD